MANYAEHVSRTQTPQTEQAHPAQAANNAGGFSFVVDDWQRLDSFLILGAEGGTYYVGERQLTKQNAACIERCLKLDAKRTIERIADLSISGRAPKQDPAIFALALAAASDSVEARNHALDLMPSVCRTGTDLFKFVAAVKQLRGFGKSLKRGLARWYTERPVDKLVYQVIKYQQRDGWSHRDVLRLTHVVSDDPALQAVLRYIVSGAEGLGPRSVNGRSYVPLDQHLPEFIGAYETLKKATSAKEVVALIGKHGFTHEMIPSQFKKDPEVWEALLVKMPMKAMVRSLARMTAMGLIAPMSSAARLVIDRLGDAERVVKARLHPIASLTAMLTYAVGQGLRGKLTWVPVQQVVDALDGAFYHGFGAVTPTGARTMLAIDVSGSMQGGHVAGVLGLTPAIAAAAMAMVTARVEKTWDIVGFSERGFSHPDCESMHFNLPSCITPLNISPKQRLDTVVQTMRSVRMGGTNCALPMMYALERRIAVDVFHIYTDSETYWNSLHPHQALAQYRNAMGIKAKLIVAGMVSNGFTIANPDDAGMLDVIGFDAAAPAIMADFGRPADGLTPSEGAGYREPAMREEEETD